GPEPPPAALGARAAVGRVPGAGAGRGKGHPVLRHRRCGGRLVEPRRGGDAPRPRPLAARLGLASWLPARRRPSPYVAGAGGPILPGAAGLAALLPDHAPGGPAAGLGHRAGRLAGARRQGAAALAGRGSAASGGTRPVPAAGPGPGRLLVR